MEALTHPVRLTGDNSVPVYLAPLRSLILSLSKDVSERLIPLVWFDRLTTSGGT